MSRMREKQKPGPCDSVDPQSHAPTNKRCLPIAAITKPGLRGSEGAGGHSRQDSAPALSLVTPALGCIHAPG